MSKLCSQAIVYTPLTRPSIDRPSVILYGSIASHSTADDDNDNDNDDDDDDDDDWRIHLTNSLSDLPVAILNPHRQDWDNTWIEDMSFPAFREQVDWEMDHARLADVIVFYFAPATLAPVALLELGMYLATGKVVVCCPEGFHKRGNVQMACLRHGVVLLDSLSELCVAVRARLVDGLDRHHGGRL